MKKFRDKMDEVKVESYKDCVWYVKHLDKCKMCDAHEVNLPCHCKEEMDDFCTWVTKFFKASPSEDEISEEDAAVAEKYISLDRTEEEESLLERIMSALY